MKFNLKNLMMTNRGREAAPLKLENAATEATIYIYDVIDADWGVGAKDVIAAINASADAKVLNVRLNSPGGDVFEGRAIMEAIKRFEGKTIAHIDALAASAATSIACACDEVIMADGALYMIHNASGLVWGDKNDMRQTADLLEKVEGSIVNDYTGKTGMDAASVTAMMDAETWMTAQEALDNKFVDQVCKTAKAKNTWNLSAFSKAPPVPDEEDEETQPAAAGFFMSQSNANKLKLLG
jgi:ATP-dependent Clp protease protease subunit